MDEKTALRPSPPLAPWSDSGDCHACRKQLGAFMGIRTLTLAEGILLPTEVSEISIETRWIPAQPLHWKALDYSSPSQFLLKENTRP